MDKVKHIIQGLYGISESEKMIPNENARFTLHKTIECLEKALEEHRNEWTLLTDDEESYPECFEYVLIEDDIGDKNVAYCHPDYEWYISNGEDSLKLIGEVIKWKKLE